MPKFQFKPHIIDQNLPRGAYAQTALADLDNDGRLEFIMGQQYGSIFWYKCHTPDQWTRHLLGENSPSDVGGCVLDANLGGHEAVLGTSWAAGGSTSSPNPGSRTRATPSAARCLSSFWRTSARREWDLNGF